MDSIDLTPLLVFAGFATILVILIALLSRQLLRQRAVNASRAKHRHLSDRLARELSAAPAGGERAQEIVDSQLFLSRVAMGQGRARIRLREVMGQSVERLSPAVAAQGFTLRLHHGGDPQVIADPGALGYALDQLLKSGLRSTRQPPVLQAHLTTQGKQAEVSVLAEGMTYDDLQLAVVRQIVEVQGGEVHQDSAAVRMRLPLAT